MQLTDLIQQPNSVIIDVRETWEFSGGHVEGSLNIPLGEVPSRMNEIAQMGNPIILVCASGNRSGMAAHFLAARGVQNVYNGGGWYETERARRIAKRA
ncbi:MAG: rhodanese-like domain-containing protein [Saprospiraceae bacterium]